MDQPAFFWFCALIFSVRCLSSVADAAEATLAWSANQEADLAGYYFYYKDPVNGQPLTKGNFSDKVDIGNVSTFKKVGLGPGTHAFALSAYDTALNESGLSAVVFKVVSAPDSEPNTASPPVPGDSGLVISDINATRVFAYSATVSWKTNAAASAQVHYWQQNDSSAVGSTILNDVAQDNHQHVLSDLKPATPYAFEVVSVDAKGRRAAKIMALVTANAPVPPDLHPPEDIKRFAAQGGDGQVTLSWNGAPDLDFKGTLIRYRTDRPPTEINDGMLFGDFVGQPNARMLVMHDGLRNGLTHYYLAAAYDAHGNYQSTVFAQATPSPDGLGASDAVSAGGCGILRPEGARRPGLGDAAALPALIVLMLVMFLKRKAKRRPPWV